MRRSQKVVNHLLAGFILIWTLGCIPLATPTNLPKHETNILTPTKRHATSTELINVSSTATQTEIPTPTLTREPTEIPSTATPVIDFPIPEAPPNADVSIWREAYINAMLYELYIRRIADAGNAKPYWDSALKTVVWDLDFGPDKYAYNTEFGFTGRVVTDTYGKEWIVKKVVAAPRTAVMDYYRLHKTGKNELIMGIQCFEKTYDAAFSVLRCLIVGQVVAVETLNMEDALVNPYETVPPKETDILFDNTNNYDFVYLRVRVPAWDSYREVKIPVCPMVHCDNEVVTIQTAKAGYQMTGSAFLNRIDPGDMVFAEFGLFRTNPMDPDEFEAQFENVSEDVRIRQSMFDAFGNGSLLAEVLNREFGLNLSTQFPDSMSGILPMFDLEKLTQENIVIPASDYIH
jgi:hypothetical protein